MSHCTVWRCDHVGCAAELRDQAAVTELEIRTQRPARDDGDRATLKAPFVKQQLDVCPSCAALLARWLRGEATIAMAHMDNTPTREEKAS